VSDNPLVPTPPELTRGKRSPDLVTVPDRYVLCIRGGGPPDAPAFEEAVAALYAAAYGLRAARKRKGRLVFKVGPMDGAWWAEGEELPVERVPDPSAWRWELRLSVPSDTVSAEVTDALESVISKKTSPEARAAAERIELRRIPSARYARVLHVGPYSDEPQSFAGLDAFLAESGVQRERSHVEVYLSDPRRTPAERLKTVLLAPIR
jgi:hypothetical protein